MQGRSYRSFRSSCRVAVIGALVASLPLVGGLPAVAADAPTSVTPDAVATDGLASDAVASEATTGSAATGRAAARSAARSADAELESRVQAAIRRALGARADDVSVRLHDRRTNVTVDHNASMRNCTGSIVKVLVLVALVRERREDGRRLSANDRSLARRMITMSDNDATSTLLSRLGGRSGLQRVAQKLGMKNTSVEWSWGRTVTTAADQALLIDAIVDGDAFTDRDDQAYVLDLMGKVIPEQAWGVGSVPDAADVALKNGWVPLTPRGWRVNSIGHVTGPGRDYTLAMLSYDNATMDQGVRVLDAVSKAVYQTVGSAGKSSAGGAQQAAPAVPTGAPDWLLRPGMAFPPYPAW